MRESIPGRKNSLNKGPGEGLLWEFRRKSRQWGWRKQRGGSQKMKIKG